MDIWWEYIVAVTVITASPSSFCSAKNGTGYGCGYGTVTLVALG